MKETGLQKTVSKPGYIEKVPQDKQEEINKKVTSFQPVCRKIFVEVFLILNQFSSWYLLTGLSVKAPLSLSGCTRCGSRYITFVHFLSQPVTCQSCRVPMRSVQGKRVVESRNLSMKVKKNVRYRKLDLALERGRTVKKSSLWKQVI